MPKILLILKLFRGGHPSRCAGRAAEAIRVAVRGRSRRPSKSPFQAGRERRLGCDRSDSYVTVRNRSDSDAVRDDAGGRCLRPGPGAASARRAGLRRRGGVLAARAARGALAAAFKARRFHCSAAKLAGRARIRTAGPARGPGGGARPTAPAAAQTYCCEAWLIGVASSGASTLASR